MSKYYAVKVGRVQGIYTTWSEAEQQVKGYSGAKFKSFSTKGEAEAFLEDIPTKVQTEYMAYVDGSFDQASQCYGSGVVILKNNEVIDELSFYGNDSIYVESYQIAGEVSAAIGAIEWAIEHGVKELTIAYDYEGIKAWALGEWNANKSVSRDYIAKFEEYIDKFKQISFQKVKGHSGDTYNDRADQLAALSIVTKKEKR